MQSMAFALPILPGNTEADRAALESCMNGERTAAYRASRERLGYTRESVWIQTTPAGDFVVVYLEGEDLEAAMVGISTSSEPFDCWFREFNKEMHGVDLANGSPTTPELCLDYRAVAAAAPVA